MVLPDGRVVDFEITWDDAEPTIGSVAHFTATLSGYETLLYNVQWQYSEDGVHWNDLEGSTDMTMDVEINMDNYEYFWRVVVKVMELLKV